MTIRDRRDEEIRNGTDKRKLSKKMIRHHAEVKMEFILKCAAVIGGKWNKEKWQKERDSNKHATKW